MKYLYALACAITLVTANDLSLLELAYANALKPMPSDLASLADSLGMQQHELSKEKIALGKKLFFEKELSLAKNISCATCHSFEKGGADALPTAIGHKNLKNPNHLNTPTVLNTAFSKHLFWDGHVQTLQEQAKGPLQAPFEMAITPPLAQERIAKNPEYAKMFVAAFGDTKVTFEKITEAIGAYEKTLLTRGRYDEFLLGYFDALTQTEKEGLELFITKGCVGCHNGVGLGGGSMRKFPLTYHGVWSMEKPAIILELQKKYDRFLEAKERKQTLQEHLGAKNFALLQEGFFAQVKPSKVESIMNTMACTYCHEHNSDVIKQNLLASTAFPFENRGGILGADKNTKYYRVPLLRNVVRTKPYFHNGSIERLEEAIKIMGIHQSRVRLDDAQIQKIIAFLKAADREMVSFEK